MARPHTLGKGRKPVSRPRLLLPPELLPPVFRAQSQLLERPPWNLRGAHLPERRYSPARACFAARQFGFDTAQGPFLARLGYLTWEDLSVPIPPVPWEKTPGTDEPGAAPLLLELSWRWGFCSGLLGLWQSLSAFTLRRTLLPYVFGRAHERDLPLVLDVETNPRVSSVFLTPSEARAAKAPWWPTFVRRELNAHDSAGVRVSETNYWPRVSLIPDALEGR